MYLPKPYPDELIGSVLIRGYRRSGLRLNRFLSSITDHATESHPMLTTTGPRMAHACGMDPECLLREHTLIPYALAFRPNHEREVQFAKLCAFRDGHALGSYVQKMAPNSRRLAFCPACAAEERVRFGEPYWHREHQITGFCRCIQHLLPLEYATSDIWVRSASMPGEVFARRLSDDVQASEELALRLCQGIRHALRWELAVTDDSPARYRQLCKRGRYWSSNRRVYGGLLSRDLAEHYGHGFLAQVRCVISDDFGAAWPARMLHHAGRDFSSVKHILLSTFLEAPGF